MSEPDPSPLLRIESLVTGFGDQIIHDQLDLTINEGEILGLIGASGSGKSVLIHTMLGLNRARAGRIWFHDRELLSLSAEELRRLQRCWGVLFQGGALFSGLTVLENIEQPMKETLALPAGVRCELADLWLRLVGLPLDTANKFPSELAAGMVKRAALARSLALEPEILILDEPTAGLDPISAEAFDTLLTDLHQALGLTVIIATHDPHTLVKTCQRITALVDGRAVTGTLDELAHSSHPWLQKYFGGTRMRALAEV